MLDHDVRKAFLETVFSNPEHSHLQVSKTKGGVSVCRCSVFDMFEQTIDWLYCSYAIERILSG